MAPRRRARGRQVPRMWHTRARLRPHPLRRLCTRVRARVLLQVPLLLPKLQRQAVSDLDAVAGHDLARAGAAPAGGACHHQAAARLLSCLLGEIARVAARTVTAVIRTLTGERDLAVGIVACLQTHGARTNWHPHLHLLVTDGGPRPDGTFVTWPVQDTARLTEAFRRAVLRLFVRLELFDEDQDAGMLTWPHSGFHGHTAVWHGALGPRGRSRVRHPPRALLRPESRRARAADLRPRRQDGDVRRTSPTARRRAPRPPTRSSSWPACWCTSLTRATSPRGARHRRGPPRAGAWHAPHARPPTLRRSPEDGPHARQSVLARTVIASYTRPIVDPPRFKFLIPVEQRK